MSATTGSYSGLGKSPAPPSTHSVTLHGSDVSSVEHLLPTDLYKRELYKAANISLDIRWRESQGLTVLYAPPNPRTEIIFVHGLGGGPVRTWSRDGKPSTFWPKMWLPREPDFENSRIYSFGYPPHNERTESVPTHLELVSHSLLNHILTSPDIGPGVKNPIILVGHSLGGLIAKNAYLLAHQNPRARGLVQNIGGIVFLATPHRGTDFAKVVSHRYRKPASDVAVNPDSRTISASVYIQAVNRYFSAFSSPLVLHSFYEANATSLGSLKTGLVLDREAATLGFETEQTSCLHAAHDDISSFASPASEDYIAVRDALANAVDRLRRKDAGNPIQELSSFLPELQQYLNISFSLPYQLANLKMRRAKGTCHWLYEKEPFLSWLDMKTPGLHTLCLTGLGGSGKTVLSAHTIGLFQDIGLDVSYYFCHGDATASEILRMLAYQMAVHHPLIRLHLFYLKASGVVIHKDDFRGLWRKLFLNLILKTPLLNQQFWFLDGLDEYRGARELIPLLSKADVAYPLKLFLSFRPVEAIPEMSFSNSRTFYLDIGRYGNRQDIRLYIKSELQRSRLKQTNLDSLTLFLVQKSCGSFLWASLVLREIGKSSGADSMSKILANIPAGLEALYTRIFAAMGHASVIEWERTIIDWIVCASRPLKLGELRAALEVELLFPITQYQLHYYIEHLGGQILWIDSVGTVHFVHASVRDFLTKEDRDSQYAIREPQVHEKLAIACLEYLCQISESFLFHRQGSKRGAHRPGAKFGDYEFEDYAVTSWFKHLAEAPSDSSTRLLESLASFFNKMSFLWISTVAKKKDLAPLVHASRSIHKYLDRRARYFAPDDRRVAALRQWSVDLVRIVTKFGGNLLLYPDSIHLFIPILCPGESIVSKSIPIRRAPWSFTTGSNSTWGDSVCYIDHQTSRAICSDGGDPLFAIGFASGQVKFYNGTTCQESGLIEHGEAVHRVKFDHSTGCIATSGSRSLKLWSLDALDLCRIEGTLSWSLKCPISGYPVLLAFSEDDLALAVYTSSNDVMFLTCMDGKVLRTTSPSDKTSSMGRTFDRVASSLSISPDLRIVAVATRGEVPSLWSTESERLEYIGLCKHEENDSQDSGIRVLFNPNPAIELLSVAYQSGKLSLFRYQLQKVEFVASVSSDTRLMSAAVDGLYLATVGNSGNITIWAFETLTRIHCINLSAYPPRSLTFNGDGSRLLGTYEDTSRVWEPVTLVRSGIEGDGGVFVTTERKDVAPIVDDGRYCGLVTSVQTSSPPLHIFVGRNDGTLHYYTGDGESSRELYRYTKKCAVRNIAWHSESQLLAACFANTLLVFVLKKSSESGSWQINSALLDIKCDKTITNLSFSLDGSSLWCQYARNLARMPLSGLRAGDKHQFSPLLDEDSEPFSIVGSCILNLPSGSYIVAVASHDQLLMVKLDQIGVPCSKTLVVELRDPDERLPHVLAEKVYFDDTGLILVGLSSTARTGLATSVFHLYNLDNLIAEKIRQPLNMFLKADCTWESPDIRSFLGFSGCKAIFMDQDLWIRSYELALERRSWIATANTTQFQRHFFIPLEWIGGRNDSEPLVTRAGDFIFPTKGELAVVGNVLNLRVVENPLEEHPQYPEGNSMPKLSEQLSIPTSLPPSGPRDLWSVGLTTLALLEPSLVLTNEKDHGSFPANDHLTETDLATLYPEIHHDLALERPKNGIANYVCTPSSSVSTDVVPLRISGVPVVIPVEAQYPLRGALVPPADPYREPINFDRELSENVINDIFDLFHEALGFYVLLGGRLQLIVPDDFDYEEALSQKPHEFGGLSVSYIQQSLTPCTGRWMSRLGLAEREKTHESTNPSSTDADVSNDEAASQANVPTPATSHTSDGVRMTFDSNVQAVAVGKRNRSSYEGRIGVLTQCAEKKYITISTHVVTSALLAAKCPLFPGNAWAKSAVIYCDEGRRKLGSIAETFDIGAGHFPAGFSHDISLLDVTDSSDDFICGLQSPVPASWFTGEDWHAAKYSTTKLALLSQCQSTPAKTTVKTIGLMDSQCQSVGQAIFRMQPRPKSGYLSRIRGKREEDNPEDWTRLVARCLLFRVHPDARPKGAQSGSAICVMEEMGDGTKNARVAGFTAFSQETNAVQNFDTDGPRLYAGLEQGRVAFYGAFQIPVKLSREHVIL